MHRRRVLQIGAAVAVSPLPGCGSAPADPKTAQAASNGPGGAAGSAAPAPSVTPAIDAPAPPGSAVPEPVADPAPPAIEEKPPESTFSRVIARVGKNHGHVFAVTFADVKAGAEKTYDLAGPSGHRHAVTLTPDDMKNLLAGQLLRTKSTKGLTHVHRVLLRCAPPVDPPEWVSVCQAEFSGKDEHEIVIPVADMDAKAERTYDVQGIAGHPHQLTVTAAHFQKLANGEAVSIQTTRDESDAHLHVVFIQYKRPKAT